MGHSEWSAGSSMAGEGTGSSIVRVLHQVGLCFRLPTCVAKFHPTDVRGVVRLARRPGSAKW